MQFKQLKSFRKFVLLLLTIFFINTVYASGMMVAEQLCDTQTVSTESHNHDNHDNHDMHQHDNHKSDAEHTQSTNDHCSKCGHCMACFTILPPSQLEKMQSQVQAIEVLLFKPSYLSHVSAHPQRPPIS